MLSARTVNLIIWFAILVFASANASAQTPPIGFNSIPHPAAKLNTLIGYRSKLIAGNADGIFVSADNGQMWVAQNSGLPSPIQVTLLVSVNNLIFAATDRGIWKSDNEAQSWSDSGAGVLTNQAVSALYVLGENIFAGTSSGDASGKVMRSSNYGQSWKDVSAGLPAVNYIPGFSSVGNTILISFGSQLFKSTDYGNSWKSGSTLGLRAIATTGPIILAIGDYVPSVRTYAARWSSSDLGDSWKLIEDRGGSFIFPSFSSLVASGSNILFCYEQQASLNPANAYSSFEASLDAGKTFSKIYLYYNQGSGKFDKIFLVDGSIYLTKVERSSGSFLELLQSSKVLTPYAASVSAANYRLTPLASESLASVFSSGMALTTAAATGTSFPTSVENISVLVTDSAGTEKLAPILYVSPTQINFQVPTGLVGGTGTVLVKLYNPNNPYIPNPIVAGGMISIANTSPGLFSVNQTGEGFAAATVQRVTANGSVTFDSIAQYDSIAQKFIPLPINVQADADQVYLNLYGTGIRGRSEIANVKATIDGIDVPVLYAGAQGSFLGVDQVNVLLPSSLAGKKEVNVILTVDNQVANPVKIFIQ
jgi:uncharacterized protein (TIGR03437 family)